MNLPPKRKLRREEIPAGDCLCDHCSAKCCKLFRLQIDTPTTREEFDYIRWYLMHAQAAVFVEEGAWYVLVHTVCKLAARQSLRHLPYPAAGLPRLFHCELRI